MNIFLAKGNEGRLTKELYRTNYGIYGRFHKSDTLYGERKTRFYDFKVASSCLIDERQYKFEKGCLFRFEGVLNSYSTKKGTETLTLAIHKIEVIKPPFGKTGEDHKIGTIKNVYDYISSYIDINNHEPEKPKENRRAMWRYNL